MSTAVPAPFLSLIFSFRNEQETLPFLIERVRTVCQNLRDRQHLRAWELIFVNDASSDDSLPILLKAAKGHDDLKIINMSRNFGLAPCVIAGLTYSKGDLAVYMDSDLQDPPEIIPQMLKTWREGDHIDVVHTVRTSRKGESAFKLFLTGIGYSILNRYSSVPIPREAGDFKLISRRVIDHLVQFKEPRPFIRGLISYIGFNQAFITYEREARFRGTSKFFVLGKKVISNFLNSALINFSSVPLQIASYCGLFAILIDFLLIIYTLLLKITGHTVGGWSALMIVILFIGGVQLFCIGMIGLYLNSVHEASKARPTYIISSSYGFNSSV
jgi:glycosyltransferase involved in cell wall biosynthesis